MRWLAGIADQPEERYRSLFNRHHRAVYAYCRRRTDAQTAADCVADTFLVAWRRLDDVPNGDAALRWFYGVARKTLANEGANERFMSAVIVGEAGLIAVGTDVWASPDGLPWSWDSSGC